MDGRRIGGRYRLLQQRAIGGMAAVWRGRDERTGRDVAVKLLHPHLVADPDARRRLQREARATEALEHPNVVAVHAVVADRDAPAVVMDYVEGRSLAERLQDEGPLPEEQALAIARDVAHGLAAAHEAGIVHRDVKPGNILLTPEGTARLGDFGIATDLGADMTALTGEQGVIGTLRYMAPERLLGEPAVPATDVWGLGAVLYEMVAGRPAFEASGGVLGAERGLPARPEGMGHGTWAVVQRALAADPSDRYPDGAALAAALAGSRSAAVEPFDDAETAVVPVAAGAGAAAAVAPPGTGSVAAAPLGTGAVAAAPNAGPAAAPRGSVDRRRPMVAVAAIALGALLLGGALIGLGGAGESAAGIDPSPTPTATAAPTATEEPPAEDADADTGGGSGGGGGEKPDKEDKPDKPGKDDDKDDGNGQGRGGGNGNGNGNGRD